MTHVTDYFKWMQNTQLDQCSPIPESLVGIDSFELFISIAYNMIV